MEVFVLLLIAFLMSPTNANTDDYDYYDFGDPFVNIGKLYPHEPTEKPVTTTTTTTTTTVSPLKKWNKEYLPKDCGVSSTSRIIGGKEADLGEYPWMALLQYKQGNRPPTFLCGGSLISKRYVLTAAHCLKVKNYKLIGVRLGEHDTRTPIDCVGRNRCAPRAIDVGLEETISHSGWNERAGFDDIALLRLEKDIPFTAMIQPICLPKERNDLESKLLYVAGWGRTEQGGTSPVKLKVAVPVVSSSTCAKTFRAFDKTGEKQICAGGEKSKDSCSGDSGGPLMSMEKKYGDKRRVYQRGIVSFGPRNCGRAGKPAVYTRVTTYLSWIMDNIRP